MTDIAARAALVPAANVGEALTTSVSRLEIEDVLESEEAPIELVLDVTRFSDGEAAETRSIAVSWERSDLEKLLKEAQGDNVVLTFDREALRQAMESDVEAHGIRDKALILAVAATAATGVAATAHADPGLAPGMRGAVAQSTATQDDRAVSRATPTAPDSIVSSDDRAVPRSAPAPDPMLSPDDRAVPRSAPATAPEPVLGPDDRAVPRATPVPTVEPINVSDPGITWAPTPAETVALAGAIALAITGAFFLVGGRRRVRPGAA